MARLGLYLCIFLVLCVSLVISTTTTTKDKSNETTDEKSTIEAGIRAAVKQWEHATSGFPVNCRRIVDLFADDGVAEVPAGVTVVPAGRKLFGYCEQNLLPHFTHIETFVSSPLHISGTQVAFERSSLFVTKTNCRLVSKGITTITYDKDFKIKVLKEYVNEKEFASDFAACQFPSTPAEEKQKKRDGEKEL